MSVDDPQVTLPLKFAGGFGIDSRRIGAIFTIFSVTSMLAQFLLFPVLARRWGVLTCLRIAFCIFPVVYFLTPFVSLLPTRTSKEAVMVILLIIRGVGGTFAFPTSTIMLTNSAPSMRVLGTINGLATSVSAVGRATGPFCIGGLFTWSLKKGYVIIPFWTLSLISFLAFIPTLWLEEGKGFGDDPDSDEDSVLSASAPSDDMVTEEDEAINGSAPVRFQDENAAQSESEYGEPGALLSYTSTRNSVAVASDDEADFASPGRHGRRRDTGGSSRLQFGRSVSNGRQHSQVRRRSSVPVGMGTGFRRLSSNLGSTGVGAGGAGWGGT